MELKLVSSEAEVVKLAVDGQISRDGWKTQADPINQFFGESIFSRKVIVDLSGTDYLDSTGVEWLLSCHDRFTNSGGQFVLHSPNPVTFQLLKTMRMDLVLNIVKDETSALEKLNEHPHNEHATADRHQ